MAASSRLPRTSLRWRGSSLSSSAGLALASAIARRLGLRASPWAPQSAEGMAVLSKSMEWLNSGLVHRITHARRCHGSRSPRARRVHHRLHSRTPVIGNNLNGTRYPRFREDACPATGTVVPTPTPRQPWTCDTSGLPGWLQRPPSACTMPTTRRWMVDPRAWCREPAVLPMPGTAATIARRPHGQG